MKVLFIYKGTENLGIEYISSFLKSKGHEVHLLFDPGVFSGDRLINNKLLSKIFSVDEQIVTKTIEYNPDIVAFSTYTGNYRWCLDIAKKIRRSSSVPIVFGGVHTTAVPNTVLANAFIDFAIVGEGEFAMADLLRCIEKGFRREELLNTPNISFNYQGVTHLNTPRPYIRDLDSLPFPDKTLFYDKIPMFAKNYLIVTSRGCPYNCTYCSNNMYHNLYCKEKNHIRRRSPENVIEELTYAKLRWDIELVNFADDVFTFSKSWLEKFIPVYKSKINLPFCCSVHPMTISKEVVSLLNEGGCWLITMGVQTGSERIRSEIFNRAGKNEKILEAASIIKNAGIKLSVDNIFGAPSEAEDDLKQSLELYNKMKADRILTFWLTYFPETEIINHAKIYGELSDNDVNNIKEGIIGSIHDTGSVNQEMFNIYFRYQLLFQLRSLFHNDRSYYYFSRLLLFLPFKGLIGKLLIMLNALKNKDAKFFYLLEYIGAKKNTP